MVSGHICCSVALLKTYSIRFFNEILARFWSIEIHILVYFTIYPNIALSIFTIYQYVLFVFFINELIENVARPLFYVGFERISSNEFERYGILVDQFSSRNRSKSRTLQLYDPSGAVPYSFFFSDISRYLIWSDPIWYQIPSLLYTQVFYSRKKQSSWW